MFAREIFLLTVLACAFLQASSAGNDDNSVLPQNGMTRLAKSSLTGMGAVLDSGAHAAASGVDLTTTSLTHGIDTLSGTADLATNAQKIKYDVFRNARRAAGRFGESLTQMGGAALTGALQRGAEAIEAAQRATEFTLAEARRVSHAGSGVAKSILSNTSGSFVNALNGITKMVTSTGEVREEVADSAGAIHEAGTDLVKEGVRTWKDMSLGTLNRIKTGMQQARQAAQTGVPSKPDQKPITNTDPKVDPATNPKVDPAANPKVDPAIDPKVHPNQPAVTPQDPNKTPAGTTPEEKKPGGWFW